MNLIYLLSIKLISVTIALLIAISPLPLAAYAGSAGASIKPNVIGSHPTIAVGAKLPIKKPQTIANYDKISKELTIMWARRCGLKIQVDPVPYPPYNDVEGITGKSIAYTSYSLATLIVGVPSRVDHVYVYPEWSSGGRWRFSYTWYKLQGRIVIRVFNYSHDWLTVSFCVGLGYD